MTKQEWLKQEALPKLAKTGRVVTWILTAVVLVLVGLMRNPALKVALPEGISLGFLPAVHAGLNAGVAVCLVLALVAIRRGNVAAHRGWMMGGMVLSILFLLCYVAYHFTTVSTPYGGEGAVRVLYFFLLISHIVLAGVSLPLILLTFVAAWSRHFAQHRRMAKWVFPLWLYVAVTGPICYWMLRPYY